MQNPYKLFHGALAHRHLLIGLDSEASGDERPGLFPMINVGLVYCNRCAPHGPAQHVLTEVSRRVHGFLLGPLRWFTKHGRTTVGERLLWEQDLFKDAIEHVAFRRPEHESRHALANTDQTAAARRHPAARGYRWSVEQLLLAPGLPPQPSPWLRLLSDGESRGESVGAGARDESLSGLPLWIFSPWNVPPHGAACAGQWALRPSPVMVGHLVGCTSKLLVMRQLGWWHYDASATDDDHRPRAAVTAATAAAATAAAAAATTRSALLPGVQQAAPPTSAAVARALPSSTASAASGLASGLALRLAFPLSTRVLVLRHHGIRITTPQDVGRVWEMIRRFSLLALASGRRAILPLVPCPLTPCAPRVPNPLRTELFTITLGDPQACETPAAAASPAPAGGDGVESQPSDATAAELAPRAVDAPLGWAPSPNTSRWWWSARRERGRVARGCCQAVPSYGSCIDPAGARRALREEPLLCAADLARLLDEHRWANHSGLLGGTPMLATFYLPRSDLFSAATLAALREQRARVLVADARHDALARLPSIEWLRAEAGASQAKRLGLAQVHSAGARCFAALARGK